MTGPMNFPSGFRGRLKTDYLTSPHTSILESLNEQFSLRWLLNQGTTLLVLTPLVISSRRDSKRTMFRIEHVPLGPICENIIVVSYLKIVGILKTVESASLTFPLPNMKSRKV